MRVLISDMVRSRVGFLPVAIVLCSLLAACSSSNTGASGGPSGGAGGPGASCTTGTTVPAAAPSAGCQKAPAAPGVSDRTMMSDGVERKFQLIVPKNYDGKKPLPVVLGLHSLTVSYLIVPGMAGFADMASRYGPRPRGAAGADQDADS